MTRYLRIVFTVVIIFSGCASAPAYKSSQVLNQLKVGMTKYQAIAVLGNPESINARNNAEDLSYILSDDGDEEDYYVRIVNDKVIYFGRPGSSRIMNYLIVGMTKGEAIDLLGEPIRISAINNQENLVYSMEKNSGWGDDQYYVRLFNGKIESFGLLGDFDSTKPKTIRIEKDETIKQEITIKTE